MSSIYRRGSICLYKCSIDGKPHYESLKTKNKRVAKALQKIDDRIAKRPKSNNPDDLDCLASVYLDWLQ